LSFSQKWIISVDFIIQPDLLTHAHPSTTSSVPGALAAIAAGIAAKLAEMTVLTVELS
jgi:hypothetical protein